MDAQNCHKSRNWNTKLVPFHRHLAFRLIKNKINTFDCDYTCSLFVWRAFGVLINFHFQTIRIAMISKYRHHTTYHCKLLCVIRYLFYNKLHNNGAATKSISTMNQNKIVFKSSNTFSTLIKTLFSPLSTNQLHLPTLPTHKLKHQNQQEAKNRWSLSHIQEWIEKILQFQYFNSLALFPFYFSSPFCCEHSFNLSLFKIRWHM